MHVRCLDYAGNPNINEYLVNLCLKEGPDNTAARIIEYVPEDGSFLKYEETTQVLMISLDEPADCRWTHDIDKLYDEMENNMSCEDYEPNVITSEWSCSTELTDLTEPVNNIYIKCKDQPWIDEEAHNCDGLSGEDLEECEEALSNDIEQPWAQEDRNVNVQGFLYVLQTTESPLVIDSISPQGEVIRGGDLSEVDLEVTTSGGVNNGVSICEYEFIESPSGINVWDIFFETNSKNHRQPFNLQDGDYNILITCTDEIGNKAEGNTLFDLTVDKAPPIIVRIYKEGGNLKLITDEQAKCYYDVDRCYFNLNEKEDTDYDMTTGYYATEHSTKWNPGVTYHIRCEDIFGNINEDCAIKIIPSS